MNRIGLAVSVAFLCTGAFAMELDSPVTTVKPAQVKLVYKSETGLILPHVMVECEVTKDSVKFKRTVSGSGVAQKPVSVARRLHLNEGVLKSLFSASEAGTVEAKPGDLDAGYKSYSAMDLASKKQVVLRKWGGTKTTNSAPEATALVHFLDLLCTP